MSYIAITINHVRAIKAWAHAHGGQANLDLLTFELEVKARHRYFVLFPQFLALVNGRLAHVPQLTPDVIGFIGWLPYRAIQWPLSTDKMVFKRCLLQAGLATPAWWQHPQEATQNYIFKHSVGSFGNDLMGPFHVNERAQTQSMQALEKPNQPGSVYVEQFIQGRNLKVWYWGEHAFHAQLHPYPLITGDGQQTLQALIAQRLEKMGQRFSTYAEMPIVVQSLAYQGVNLETVLAAEQSVWIDFRYGRRFAPDAKNEAEDNALPQLASSVLAQITQAGQFLAREVDKEVHVPVLYSVDGVLDDNGRIWWLEINSNPIFAPTGYPYMLATLFDTPIHAHIPPQTAGSLSIDPINNNAETKDLLLQTQPPGFLQETVA